MVTSECKTVLRVAQECREQAKRMFRREDRDALERLAQIWEKLADVREHQEPEMSFQSN